MTKVLHLASAHFMMPPPYGGPVPPQRTLAGRTDEAADTLQIRRVEVVRHPAGLVPADMDVWASEDGRNAGQHLIEHFCKCRGQFRVKPRGVMLVTGRELELDKGGPRRRVRACEGLRRYRRCRRT
jgi:hypothetical protein